MRVSDNFNSDVGLERAQIKRREARTGNNQPDHKSFYFPLRASALSFNRIFETENENEREHSKGRKRDDLTAGQR